MGFGCRYPKKKIPFRNGTLLCLISPQLHLGLLATVVANATHPQSKTIERNVPGPKNVHRCTPWDCTPSSNPSNAHEHWKNDFWAWALIYQHRHSEKVVVRVNRYVGGSVPAHRQFFLQESASPQKQVVTFSWGLKSFPEMWRELVPDSWCSSTLWVLTTYLKSENLLSKIRESIICPFSQIIGELSCLQACASNTFVVINQNLQTNLCFVEWKYVNDPFSRLRP